MANNADGTDGRGAPSLHRNGVKGKVDPSFGKGKATSMPGGGKTISGKSDSSFGTKAARNSGGNVNGGQEANADRSQISKSGW